MELVEIIRWISIVMMWGVTALNAYAFIRCLRTQKKLKELEIRYEERLKMLLGGYF